MSDTDPRQGRNLRRLRKAKGMTQPELARRIGEAIDGHSRTKGYISRLEHSRTPIGNKRRQLLAEILETSEMEFFREDSKIQVSDPKLENVTRLLSEVAMLPEGKGVIDAVEALLKLATTRYPITLTTEGKEREKDEVRRSRQPSSKSEET